MKPLSLKSVAEVTIFGELQASNKLIHASRACAAAISSVIRKKHSACFYRLETAMFRITPKHAKYGSYSSRILDCWLTEFTALMP